MILNECDSLFGLVWLFGFLGVVCVKTKAWLWLLCLSILLGWDSKYYLSCFVLLKFFYISLSMVSLPLFVCVFVVCAMIVKRVYYMGAYDNADDFGIE